jgi:hypothetical protein
MYSYVLNNPLNALDPTGMECVWDDGSYDDWHDPHSGSANQCSGLGGTWVDHSYFQANNLADWSSQPNAASPALQLQQQQLTTCSLGAGGVAPIPVPGFSNNTFRASFDSNDMLNGVAVNLGDKPQTMNVQGIQASFAPSTKLGINWVNGTMPGSFSVGAKPPAQVSTGIFTSVKISSISFDGNNGFQTNGSAYFLGIPLGSGPIDNALNSNLKLVIQATDVANSLATHPVSCQALGGTQ